MNFVVVIELFCIEWYFNDLTCLSLINATLNFNFWFVLKKKTEFQFNTSTDYCKSRVFIVQLLSKKVYHLNSFLLYNLTRVGWSFCRPDVWFNVKVMKSLQIMEVPLLKSWIQANIDDGITKGLYLSVNSRKVIDTCMPEHLSNIIFIFIFKF